MLHLAASELGLHCLHMSTKQVSGVKRVKQPILVCPFVDPLTLLHSEQPKLEFWPFLVQKG